MDNVKQTPDDSEVAEITFEPDYHQYYSLND